MRYIVVDAIDEFDIDYARIGLERGLDVFGLHPPDPKIRNDERLGVDEPLQFGGYMGRFSTAVPRGNSAAGLENAITVAIGNIIVER